MQEINCDGVNFAKSTVMSSGNLFKVVDNDKRIVSFVKASNVKSNHLEVFSKENVLKTSKNPKIILAKESFLVKI